MNAIRIRSLRLRRPKDWTQALGRSLVVLAAGWALWRLATSGMSPQIAFVQTLNGLTLGVMYVIIAGGLSLIFGLMEVINFAHGALYMVGAYFGLTVHALTGNFWLALLIAPPLVGLLGMALELTTLRPLYGRHPLYHILLTFGLVLVIANLAEILWGKEYHLLRQPEALRGVARFLGVAYPKYRLFILAFGVLASALLWLAINRTRFGLVIRAGTHNREIVSAFGIDISRYFTWVFGFGVALAAAAGVVMAPMMSVHPHMGDSIIITAFIVVVVGGLGRLRGAMLGGLLVGIVESFSKILFPSFSGMIVYLLMAAVLILRPQGLLGTEELK